MYGENSLFFLDSKAAIKVLKTFILRGKGKKMKLGINEVSASVKLDCESYITKYHNPAGKIS